MIRNNDFSNSDACEINSDIMFYDIQNENLEYLTYLSVNDILENIHYVNKSDIDKGIDLVIQKEKMNISFTSTKNQKSNENKNTTTINLGKCEEKLKEANNILNDSILYILKIDIEEEGKKTPRIEYEVYYPSKDGINEKLNLSVCED